MKFQAAASRVAFTVSSFAASLFAATHPALAQTVTKASYDFRAFVEHPATAESGQAPVDYNSFVPIQVIVNTSAFLEGNTNKGMAVYGGSCYNTGTYNPDNPVLYAKVGPTVFSGEICTTLQINKNSDGSADIYIELNSPSTGSGTGVVLQFHSNSGSAVTSYSIPTSIQTLDFDQSTYKSASANFSSSGDIATKIPN